MLGVVKAVTSGDVQDRSRKPFIMTVRTTADNETFQWPNRTGTRKALIDWGDGTREWSTGNLSAHTYATAGDHDISVWGAYTAPRFNNGSERLKLIDVKQWGQVKGMTVWDYAFYGCNNVPASITATDFPPLIVSIGGMMRACSLFNTAIGHWNIEKITSIAEMFRGCTAFNQDISAWNTANVTNMSNVFRGCTAFNQDISAWNTANVTNMTGMFLSAPFNQNLSGWCVTKIASEPTDFGGAAGWTTKPVWGTCPGA